LSGRLTDVALRLREEFRRRGGSARFLLQQATGGPLDTLILTLLSQATNDGNASRAYAELRKRFPRWEDVLRADVDEIEDAIRVGGLGKSKARRIKEILERLENERGELSLDFLKGLSVREVMDYLTSFKGVGCKTAACVALFALGLDAFPVDTHILRVARRLGLVDPKATAEKAQETLSTGAPPGTNLELHLLLIDHGRRVCRARRPRCGVCPLQAVCAASNPAESGFSTSPR